MNARNNVTANNIRDRTLKNIKALQRYERTSVPEEKCRELLDDVAETGSISFGALVARHATSSADGRSVSACIRHLIARRRLDCDIGNPDEDSMKLRRAPGA